MNARRLTRPSPALVISITALVMASTGTAVAVTKITSSAQIKRGVVNSGDIRDKTIQMRDTSSKLRNALRGQRGLRGRRGPAGAAGKKGDPGAPGSALAFAHVTGATADVDEANSKNVTDANVSHGSLVGYFCFDLPFTPKSVIATVDLGSQDTGFATAQLGNSAGGCPSSAEASVKVSVDGGGGENDDFFVVFN